MGDEIDGRSISQTRCNLLGDVQVLKNVIETAVIGKTIQQSANGRFGGLHVCNVAQHTRC